MNIDPILIKKAKPIIEKIAKNRKNNNAFAYYTPEDIYQEIWLLCLESLSRYDKSIGELENFLNRHISNRIKNLKRDKYSKASKSSSEELIMTRINLINALPIDGVEINEKSKFLSSSIKDVDPADVCMTNELKNNIAERLPKELVYYFHLMIEGNKIKKSIAIEIRKLVKQILIEINND